MSQTTDKIKNVVDTIAEFDDEAISAVEMFVAFLAERRKGRIDAARAAGVRSLDGIFDKDRG